ncbi:MAG: hypothetical protein M0R80_08070 [Proteobacteria bacterium]|jgi:hypothetical protein|nr:hypothetical protein [Pseudomonadota bacterium]
MQILYIVSSILIPVGVILYFLIKRTASLQKKVNLYEEKLESQTGKTDLELATTHQIVKELVKRPNYRFMFIVPHLMQEGQGLNVEVHSSNVSVKMALDVLRATYEGVANTIRRKNPDEDEDLGDI